MTNQLSVVEENRLFKGTEEIYKITINNTSLCNLFLFYITIVDFRSHVLHSSLSTICI